MKPDDSFSTNIGGTIVDIDLVGTEIGTSLYAESSIYADSDYGTGMKDDGFTVKSNKSFRSNRTMDRSLNRTLNKTIEIEPCSQRCANYMGNVSFVIKMTQWLLSPGAYR